MGEETTQEILTIPEGEIKKEPSKQCIIRLHPSEHKLMKVMLKKDKMSFQKFITFCVRGYLDADPQLIQAIKSYRELENVPQDIQDKHVLSHRERQSILDEIEREAPSEA